MDMKAWPFQLLPHTRWSRQTPTHRQAAPALIAAAVARSLRRPSGTWYVVGASADVTSKPFGANVAGAEVVCWRGERGQLYAGPARCPHLGADLGTGAVERGNLICPWHGLQLTGRTRPTSVVCWPRTDTRWSPVTARGSPWSWTSRGGRTRSRSS